ncbi:MAG: ABC transporter permease [Planctomycetota bacterium]|jgi:putative ABC transport system permease protein|nr:ABC transporter permease [Planctomycetota bacterium]
MSLWIGTIQLGVKSLWLHPLRSLLTVLGIFIGVASVIWLLAISKGIGDEAQKQIESLGADTIMIRTIKPPSAKMATTGLTPYGLTREDYDLLVSTVPTIRSALPIREMRRQFQFKDRKLDGRLVGCTPEYADVTRLKIRSGHFITDAENFAMDTHCVIAAKVADRLFPYEDPVGQRIYMPENKNFYLVVGVLEPKSATAAIGGSMAAQDFSNDVYIPIKTLQQRIGDVVMSFSASSREGESIELNQITLRVREVADVKRTAELVEDALSSHSKMEDIAVVVPLELLEQARTTRAMFMVFMGMIAAISLLVGGIGIMNIMLATVTERTREIGIRRALGAKRRDIIRQFLVETSVLSLAGGISGILFGLLCGPAVNGARILANLWFEKQMAGLPDVVRTVQPAVVPESIPGAFFISLAVGLVFGIYPAMRAAKMNPIEALRHE